MELVYLWVEENDLIKGTDFNFGSKYIFSFTKEDKKNKGILSVKDNPNFIENFYEDNISISAIVGKNGTGKSQLLRLIWNGDINFQTNYFSIILNDGNYELICATHNNERKIFSDKMQKEYTISLLRKNLERIDGLTNLFYTNEAISLDTTYGDMTIPKNVEFLSKEFYLKEIINFEQKENRNSIQKYLEELQRNEIKDIKSNLESFLDEVEEKANFVIDNEDIDTFYISDIDEQSILDEVDNIEFKLDDIESELDKTIYYWKIKFILDSEQFEKMTTIIYDEDITWFKDMKKPSQVQFQKIDEYKWIKEIGGHLSKYRAKKLFTKLSESEKMFLYYVYSWLSSIKKKTLDDKVKEIYENIIDKYEKKLRPTLFSKNNILENKKDILENKEDFFNEMIKEYSYEKENKIYSFAIGKRYFTLLKILNEDLESLENINNINLNEKNKSKIINISKNHRNLLKWERDIAPILRYDFYPKMSSGNLIIMQTIAMLYDKLEDNESKNVLLLLDEIEVYLHPNWQKKFLKLLIGFLSSKFKDKKFHIILATHSPFLLSDIPKSNIVFLGNESINMKQTFGANIHTLLSDSFFMENGLMGEFAKGKINEIKKLYQLIQNENIQKRLEEEKTKELAQKAFYRRKKRLWQIQKIIGEPFLQKVIKNYLDELEILFSDDKILIAKELAEIEERRNYLEALQNRKG